MKVLVIGVGGIGSFLVEHIYENIQKGQLDVDVIIADSDTVEINQMEYQNFTIKDVGKQKAKVLGKRYKFSAITHRIIKERQWDNEGYERIALCVDNDRTREFVIRWCYENKVEFLDLRATGRRIFAMPKTTLKDNLRFIDDDGKEYSCQDKVDLRKGFVQIGHQVVATIGCQMILNIGRGHHNKIINLTL